MVDAAEAKKRTLRAAELLVKDILNPPSMATLADEVGLTRFELSRLLPLVVGKSGPELLRQARMEKAAELLQQNPHCRIGEVAVAVGYASMSAFCRAFQKEMGKLPTEHQDEHRPRNTPVDFPFPKQPRQYRKRPL